MRVSQVSIIWIPVSVDSDIEPYRVGRQGWRWESWIVLDFALSIRSLHVCDISGISARRLGLCHGMYHYLLQARLTDEIL